MDCPTCGVALERAKYENVDVFQCVECSGYLINRRRVILIKRFRERSPDELQAELATHQRPDTEGLMRCPKCRVERMRKQRIRVEPEGEFLLDVCKKCELVWFDGGELARLQMDHERSSQASEAEALRSRAASRSAEEKAELDKRISSLPRHSWLAEAMWWNVLAWGIVLLLAAASAVLWFSGYTVWSVVVCVVLVVCLVWVFLRR